MTLILLSISINSNSNRGKKPIWFCIIIGPEAHREMGTGSPNGTDENIVSPVTVACDNLHNEVAGLKMWWPLRRLLQWPLQSCCDEKERWGGCCITSSIAAGEAKRMGCFQEENL